MADKEFIEKGSYTHPVPDGCIALKQYIFTKAQGKRCLLLRFVNESVHTVNAFEFVITELSSDGQVIGRSRISHSALSIPCGGTFSPPSGIVVHNNCASFRIRLVYFVSGAYKHVLKHGRAVAHYDPRGYKASRPKPSIYNYVEVTPIYTKGKRVFTLIAAVAVLLVMFSVISGKYRKSNSLPAPEDSYSDSDATVIK